MKEALELSYVQEFKWVESDEQLADCLMKRGASSVKLLNALEKGCTG